MWLAEKALVKLKIIESDVADPDFSTKRIQARELAKAGTLPGLEAQLTTAELPELHRLAQYGVRWLLFKYLTMDGRLPKLRKVLDEARRIGGGSQYAEKLRAAFLAELAPKGYEEFDKGFRTWVAGLEGDWNQVYRSLEVTGSEWCQWSFPATNAVAWRQAPVGGADLEVKGEFFLHSDAKQLNVLLGRRDKSLTQVAFSRDGECVTLLHFDEAKNAKEPWRTVVRNKVPSLETRAWHPFEIRVKGSHLTVLLRGQSVLESKIEKEWMNGTWGLGALAGSAGIWRAVKAGKL
jgi:hypothetical protein